MKFKVGDKVKVVAWLYTEGKDYTGKQGVITCIDETDDEIPYEVGLDDEDTLCFMEDEIALLEEIAIQDEQEIVDTQGTIDPLTHILEPIESYDRESLYEITGYLEQGSLGESGAKVAEMLNRAIDYLEEIECTFKRLTYKQ